MSTEDILLAAVSLLEEMAASDMDSRDEARGIAKLLWKLSTDMPLAAKPTTDANKREASPHAVLPSGFDSDGKLIRMPAHIRDDQDY